MDWKIMVGNVFLKKLFMGKFVVCKLGIIVSVFRRCVGFNVCLIGGW